MIRTVFFVALACPSLLLFAADPTGGITGNVADPSGGSLVGAKVTVRSIATGLARETVSAGDGGYVFPLLPVGRYTVVVEAPGFRRFEQSGVVVRADVTVAVPVTLQIGAVSDAVTVSANAELVDTYSGTLRQTVEQRIILDLPLNGRNAATLVLLAPGTADLSGGNSRGRGDLSQPVNYTGVQYITSNGAQSTGVNYLLDGGSNVDPYTATNNPFPNPDAIEEFSVQTNNYGAQYGRSTGAVVNIVTKSGTNQLHGGAFDFFRNGALNARNFFARQHDQLKRNQFGGNLGGPIVTDKLFFFGNYQGTQIRNITAGNSAFVLTSAQRAGDFSGISRQLVDPITRVPYPNNRIPESSFSPVTKNLLPFIPVSTSPDGYVTYDKPIQQHENQFMGRMDYNLSRQRLYGRYFYTRYVQPAIPGKPNLLAADLGSNFFNQAVSGTHIFNFGPNLLNSASFAYNRNNGVTSSGAPFNMSDIGVNIAGPKPPELYLEVSGYFTVGTGRRRAVVRQTWNFTDSLHWIRGTHEIFLGGDFLRIRLDGENVYRQSGQFRFQGTSYTGHALADFMVGHLARFIQGGGEFYARNGNMPGLFAQDNIRVSRALTVNIGLRWDPFVPYGDDYGHTECYRAGVQSTRFPKAPLGYLFAGDAGCPAGGTQSTIAAFSPRLGLAYRLGSRTSLRGGFGMFYQTPALVHWNNMVDSAPFSPQFILYGVPFDNPYQGITNPFPAQFAPFSPGSDIDFQKPLVGVSYDPGWRPANVMSWNLTLEHQLRDDLLARVAYVASKGTHLSYNTDLNAAVYGAGATTSNTQNRRPNQDFSTVTQNVSGGNSIYNSLQLALDKRFARGLAAGVNYTFARSIDWNSFARDLDGFSIINPANARAYRGLSDYDLKHRLVVNYAWQLPSPKRNGLRQVLGGWQTTGIWNWQGGFPLTINSGDDKSFSGIGNDNADVVSAPGYTSGSRGDRIWKWFTTDSFRSNAPGTFGNSGRNILRGPTTFNVDFAAQKSISITEGFKAQYRAEFFNFFNHTVLNNPGTTLTSGSFGRITGAGSPRILQMALKFSF